MKIKKIKEIRNKPTKLVAENVLFYVPSSFLGKKVESNQSVLFTSKTKGNSFASIFLQEAELNYNIMGGTIKVHLT